MPTSTLRFNVFLLLLACLSCSKPQVPQQDSDIAARIKAPASHSITVGGHLYSLAVKTMLGENEPLIFTNVVMEAYAAEVERIQPVAAFQLGDMTRYATQEEWRTLTDIWAKNTAPNIWVVGNHDLRNEARFAENGGLRNKAVIIGRNKYLCLDVRPLFNSEDLAFIERQLADYEKFDHVFVMTHLRLHNDREPKPEDDLDVISRPNSGVSNWNSDVVPLLLGKVEYVFTGDHYHRGVGHNKRTFGEHTIYYVHTSFKYRHQSPALFLELQFQAGSKEFKMLPRVVGLDVRDDWYEDISLNPAMVRDAIKAMVEKKLRAEKQARLAALESDIKALVAGQTAQYAVAFQLVGSDQKLLIDASRQMHAASTMKVPVMMQLFKLMEAGELSLETKVEVVNHFQSILDDSVFYMEATEDDEASLYTKLGEKVAIEALVEAMVIHSSNLATNLLMGIADGKGTTALMRQLGAADIEVKRGVQDIKAYDAGQNNTCNAQDMLTIMMALSTEAHFRAVDSEKMLSILRRTAFAEIIPAGIPADSGAMVAHKVGRISSVEHDAALVHLSDGRAYGLVIFADHIDSEESRANVIETGRKISQHIYAHVVAH